MKNMNFKAAIQLEEASRESVRWVYNKSRKLLLQHWLAESLQTKQSLAQAIYEQFLSELNENIARLPSKKVRTYLEKVKHILCYKRRFHQGILESNRFELIHLQKKCQELNDGTTPQILAWKMLYDTVSLDVDEIQESDEYCIDGADCKGCIFCKYRPNSVILAPDERDEFKALYPLAVGTTDFWLAGTKEVEHRLAALAPISRVEKIRRKPPISKAGPWKGILNSNFSLYDLNRVLAHIGILKDETNSTLSGLAKKGSWPGVFEALEEMLKIPNIKSRTKLYEAIIFQYGQEATSLSTMRSYNSNNKASRYAYQAIKDLIIQDALKLDLKYYLH